MRRTPLNRKTPLRSKKPLNKKAKVRKRRRQREAMQYQTPKGVAFDEVRQHLPANVSEWPEVVRVLNKPQVVRGYLAEMQREHRRCPLCPPHDRKPVAEVHHLTGGSRGRADERTNLLAVCAGCHREVQSQVSEYQRVWFAKWLQDAPNVDWIRLVLLLGRWPDFEDLD
jgi:hypothetical protein